MRLLSFPLGPSTPTFVTNPKVSFEPMALIERGDKANYFQITTINHNGTHVDAPWHANNAGPRLTDLSLEWFFYKSPRLIDVPKDDDDLIVEADLQPHHDAIEAADMLLVRTGFGARVRSREPERYGRHAPGFDPSAGFYLRRFRELRAVAMDLPSASAPAHIDAGRRFHQIALGLVDPPGFFLLVEDVRLDEDLTQDQLHRVIMAPLLLEDLDGAPVTIFAE